MRTRRGMLPLLAAAPALTWMIWDRMAGDAVPRGAGAARAGGAGDGFHLPETDDTRLWRALARTRPAEGAASAGIEPAVAALEGRTVTLTGFVVPTDAGRRFRRFLFAANPPGCPGCGAGGLGRIIQARTLRDVTLRDAVARDDAGAPKPFTLTGTLRLRRDTGLIFLLDGAVPV